MQRGKAAFFKIVPVAIRQSLSTRLNIKNGDAKQQPVENSSYRLSNATGQPENGQRN